LCHLNKIIIRSLPFAALLSDPAGQGSRYLAPIHGAVLADHGHKGVVFLVSPGTLDHRWVQNFLPPVETLNVCAILEKGRDSLPVLRLKWLIHIKKYSRCRYIPRTGPQVGGVACPT
jgi:hypothetical protein